MKYKTELHCHTAEASTCAHETAAATVEKYIRHGYTTLVLTNHFSPGEQEAHGLSYREEAERVWRAYELAKATAKDRLNVLFGVELCLMGARNDYLLFGVTRNFLLEHEGIFSMKVWDVHDMCLEEGILMIQAHPMRNNMTVIDPENVDGYEVFNGDMDSDSQNDVALALAKYLLESGKTLIMTSGSDHHNPDHLPTGGIMTDEPITSTDQLISVLRSGEFELIRSDPGHRRLWGEKARKNEASGRA